MGEVQGEMYGGPLKGDTPADAEHVYSGEDIRKWALATSPEAVIAAGQAYEDFKSAFQGDGKAEMLSFLKQFGSDLDNAWGGPKSGAPECQKQLAMLWQSAKALIDTAELLAISLKLHGENHLKPFKAYFQGSDTQYSQFQMDVMGSGISVDSDKFSTMKPPENTYGDADSGIVPGL
jgi:hypothetical protein